MLALDAAERRIHLPERVVRRLRLSGMVAAAVIAVAIVGVAVASADRIADSATSVWNDVRGGAPVRRVDGPRLLSVAPYQRSDGTRRAAVDGFESAPIGGLGADGFEALYARERTHPKHSSYSHMIWLRVAAEVGVVGLLLMAALLIVAGHGLFRRLRAGPPDERRVIAIALALAAYLAFAASLDWLEEFPAIAGPVVGAVAIAALALGSPRREEARRSPGGLRDGSRGRGRRRRRGRDRPPLAVAARAAHGALAHSEPAAALAALDRASSLNPLDPLPASLAGFIELQRERPAAAQAAFRRSLRIEDGWLGHFARAHRGLAGRDRRGAARSRRDRCLDREEEIVDSFEEMLDTGEPIIPSPSTGARSRIPCTWNGRRRRLSPVTPGGWTRRRCRTDDGHGERAGPWSEPSRTPRSRPRSTVWRALGRHVGADGGISAMSGGIGIALVGARVARSRGRCRRCTRVSVR